MSKISTVQLAEFVVAELEKGRSPKLIARQVAAILLESRQTREYVKIMRQVETILQAKGTSQVHVTSAHDVSEDVKKELATLLHAQNPVFSTEIDQRVIGGVKARSGEMEIDLTVKGKLQRFKAEIMRSV